MHPLDAVEHRPWPVPSDPWVMLQSWVDFLFCHWAVDPEALRAVVPPQLPLQTWGGRAWLGIVPFHMEDVRLRFVPGLPSTTAFPELNVRTYVSVDGRPGVYFLSLDASSRIVVRVARAWYLLPYFDAEMSWRHEGGWTQYDSVRTHRGAPAAELRARYRPRPDAPIRYARPGTLEHWLTERYALYTVDRRGRVHEAQVHHAPWPLQEAEVEIERNTMGAAHGLEIDGTAPDHVLYAHRVDTLAWRPRLRRPTPEIGVCPEPCSPRS